MCTGDTLLYVKSLITKPFFNFLVFSALSITLIGTTRTHNLLYNISVWKKIGVDDEMLLNKRAKNVDSENHQ